MVYNSDQCNGEELNSLSSDISCVWIKSEQTKCQEKKTNCNEITDTKTHCIAENAVDNNEECFWLEQNESNDPSIQCVKKVRKNIFLKHLFIFIYSFIYMYVLSH
jgi:hypothetical protein